MDTRGGFDFRGKAGDLNHMDDGCKNVGKQYCCRLELSDKEMALKSNNIKAKKLYIFVYIYQCRVIKTKINKHLLCFVQRRWKKLSDKTFH